VNVTVEVEGKSYTTKIQPKELAQDLVHRLARENAIKLPGLWHPRVISGTGGVSRCQEGDVIRLFAATAETLKVVRNPRTERGSVAAIPNAIGGPPVRKQTRATKEKHDWIQELKDRGEFQQQDARAFTAQIRVVKMITLTTDGGANPNPGPAGWGVLVRQNKQCICLWKHYPKAWNNAMEISAVIAGWTFLPPDMVVWVSTDSQYVQR
jgi:hypothetical protein